MQTARKTRNLTREKTAEIVRRTECPTCGSKKGIPCRNAKAAFEDSYARLQRQSRRVFYLHFVHVARTGKSKPPLKPSEHAESRRTTAEIVRQRACPTCKSQKGERCKNMLAELQGFPGAYYNYSVHAARRRANA